MTRKSNQQQRGTEKETELKIAASKRPRLAEALPPQAHGFRLPVSGIGLVTVLYLTASTFATAQNTPGGSPRLPDAQKCSALAELNLEDASGGPTLITSARLIEVPATGLEQWIVIPSGYGSTASHIATPIHQYCDVTGYAAPQNKFELKLPLPGDWNQKFFFPACGGF